MICKANYLKHLMLKTQSRIKWQTSGLFSSDWSGTLTEFPAGEENHLKPSISIICTGSSLYLHKHHDKHYSLSFTTLNPRNNKIWRTTANKAIASEVKICGLVIHPSIWPFLFTSVIHCTGVKMQLTSNKLLYMWCFECRLHPSRPLKVMAEAKRFSS